MSYNDGGVPHGTRKVRIYAKGTANVTTGADNWADGAERGIYVLENFNPARPTYTQNRYDETRNPNGSFGVDDYDTVSCTAQLATIASKHIKRGDAFTTIVSTEAGATSESWVITQADEPESQGDIKKQSISAQKLYATDANAIPPVYPTP